MTLNKENTINTLDCHVRILLFVLLVVGVTCFKLDEFLILYVKLLIHDTCMHMYMVYIIAASRSFFGHGQCQAGTSGDIIDGV